MPVAVGPYGQTQPSCFDRVKMGFMMGFAVGMAAGAMFGTFSCLRYQSICIHLNYCYNTVEQLLNELLNEGKVHLNNNLMINTWITVK